MNPAPVYRSVTYLIQSACTAGGTNLILGAGHVTAAPSWNLVIGDVFVTIPTGAAPLTAVVSAPAEAASAPLRLSPDGC